MNLRWQELLILLILIGLLALFVWLAIWIGKKAEEKGYSRVGFTIFGLLVPLIALIVVLILQPSQQVQQQGLVKCPYCAEAIQPEARVCKHCGRDVSPAAGVPPG